MGKDTIKETYIFTKRARYERTGLQIVGQIVGSEIWGAKMPKTRKKTRKNAKTQKKPKNANPSFDILLKDQVLKKI